MWTSLRNRDAARELFTEDIDTEDAYWKDAEGCGVSPPAEVNEKVVALCPDRLGGENGRSSLYLPEEAFELTDSVRLLEEAGLMRSALCWLTLSIPFASNGVSLPCPFSLIFGGSCRRRGDIVRDRPFSDATGLEGTGACCTLATIAGLSRSYCCTVFWGPMVKSVAVGP